MYFRRAVRLACVVAGGSTAVAVAYAAWADGHREVLRSSAGLGAVIHAAQPATPSSWDNNWDKRDPSSISSSSRRKVSGGDENGVETENNKPTATRHIFLIRHSQYNLNGNGDKEKRLTALGREQAELTGQRLASLGLKYNLLIHSSMARATETAQIISTHLPEVNMVSCDLLREGAPIEPVPPVSHWKPEAVQYHEDGARIEAAFRRYIHRAEPSQKEDSYEIIICHANVIRYFVCRALQFPPEGWLRLGLNNGSITWLTVRPSGRVALRALGDSGFMPPDKVTRT
ncbi:serine/threonine-protein phosphatase PGAM5, mitochondrial isoform X1 [Silurus meridionalis]|uniref:serine/threonine-protein phosphatase PGAM5, mitochondrial isoform X1 n=1 Tax=Silurus meridionalis TaxID=175797 RepID=UPI001EEB4E9F|nr:serine/threonine-protein phosphatase PGAM5, mitochondrial isoform X1 [Silurus meridionalis]